jgi:hypothetical protein
MPTAHHDSDNVFELIEKFVNYKQTDTYLARRIPKLFYLWGHSYEFEQRNNWSHLNDLLKILSGKEDIWYATNIEIYEYVEAYERLVSSANGNVIYNPTAKTIWFTVDGEHYKLASGETLNLLDKTLVE